ncbi:MAG: DNA-processing protein DprA [Gammaproteobacteria bacterium]|nr:MAG: DNA-processing protein DprA [Gammaproteobacteria bacterium]
MDQDILSCWLALQRTPGLGARSLDRLLGHLPNIKSIFHSARDERAEILGSGHRAVGGLCEPVNDRELDAVQAWLQTSPYHHVLCWTDSDYPALLKEIQGAPLILYVRGRPEVLAMPQLAIVGSRNPTCGGNENAHHFAYELAKSGLGITSGLALGVDAAAHQGALAAGGMTVAVAGTGLGRVYPAQHMALAEAIQEQGALISEFPLDASPRREHFPRRNRLISGLSLGVLVIEAAVRSGSLITARLAAEQGREVFALPGSIHSPQARGCHRLIREGAKLVESLQDVLEELGPLAQLALNACGQAQDRQNIEPGPDYGLLEYIDFDPISVDMLVNRSGLTADVISSMLLRMELGGLVEACPGGMYQKIAH